MAKIEPPVTYFTLGVMMQNPCVGSVTSEHERDGGYKGHAGRDIGTLLNAPVYAAFGGIISNIVRWSSRGNKKSTWAPHRTGNGARIINDDGAVQGYNHVHILQGLRKGDRVQQGQLIGHVDLSGNTTGPHLHFETWSKNDPETHFSPKILYDRYSVKTSDEIPVQIHTQGTILTKEEPTPHRVKKTARAKVPVYSNRGRTKRRIDLLYKRGHAVNVVETIGSWSKVRNHNGNGGIGWIATAQLNDFFEDERNEQGEIPLGKVFRSSRRKVKVLENRSSEKVLGYMYSRGYRVHVIKRTGEHGSWAQVRWKNDTGWVPMVHLVTKSKNSSRRAPGRSRAKRAHETSQLSRTPAKTGHRKAHPLHKHRLQPHHATSFTIR